MTRLDPGVLLTIKAPAKNQQPGLCTPRAAFSSKMRLPSDTFPRMPELNCQNFSPLEVLAPGQNETQRHAQQNADIRYSSFVNVGDAQLLEDPFALSH